MIAEHLSAAEVGLCPDAKTPLNDVSTMNKTMEYMAYALPSVSFDLVETRVSGRDACLYTPSGDVAPSPTPSERLPRRPRAGRSGWPRPPGSGAPPSSTGRRSRRPTSRCSPGSAPSRGGARRQPAAGAGVRRHRPPRGAPTVRARARTAAGPPAAALGRMSEQGRRYDMRISVTGCGYLGAVHAAGLASLGHDVVGIDTDPEKVAPWRRGGPLLRAGLPEAAAADPGHRTAALLPPTPPPRPAARCTSCAWARRSVAARTPPTCATWARPSTPSCRTWRPATSWSASPPCRWAPPRTPRAPGARGPARRPARLEPGVPPRGPRHPGHPAPRPHRGRGAVGAGR